MYNAKIAIFQSVKSNEPVWTWTKQISIYECKIPNDVHFVFALPIDDSHTVGCCLKLFTFGFPILHNAFVPSRDKEWILGIFGVFSTG